MGTAPRIAGLFPGNGPTAVTLHERKICGIAHITSGPSVGCARPKNRGAHPMTGREYTKGSVTDRSRRWAAVPFQSMDSFGPAKS